jgi:hypothetical protein
MPKEPNEKERQHRLEPWQEMIRQINAETDPARVLELCRKLDEIMLGFEREKVKQKFSKGA